ncbi:DUF2817 domain-containing protein [Alkalicoccus daliensis]|uniref:Zinc carboxypeptidase n=1 Tax=Alkalicoccus daliensis TaxID=745820 RepID=A0A1H0FUU4_9BACI|nr:DUF2817 domain-containing protein [Alkalicoccus daliensis]SDN98364.1 Zinc carboxypeptidase [Alkalicoccus daliensis]
MITFPQTTPPYYDKESYEQLAERIKAEYEICEDLGVCSDGKRHLYGLCFGDTDSKPVIFMSASIHGEEWEATYWTMHFFNCIVNPGHALPEVRHLFIKLRERYSFYVIPVVNPYGFHHGIRFTEDGTDLNRQYENDDHPEVLIVKNKVKSLRPHIVLDNHTSKLPSETIGVGGRGDKNIKLIGEYIMKSMKYIRGHNDITWYREPVQHKLGIGRGWVSEQESKSGNKIFSVLIEGARTGSLGTFKDKGEFGFNTILATCLYADNFLRKGIYGGSNQNTL